MFGDISFFFFFLLFFFFFFLLFFSFFFFLSLRLLPLPRYGREEAGLNYEIRSTGKTWRFRV